MLIDGEKWACDACIRGHRVSSCQHSDRPLSHINRKGRPVSQCPHCRGLRKARANHVKCECGSKPHRKNDCKKESENTGKNKQCCCSHGSRCTCSGKRDADMATIPKTSPTLNTAPPALPALKIPANSLNSDVMGLSHPQKTRKDVNRHSHPYPIPRTHTIHTFPDPQRHSTDHLASPDNIVDQSGLSFHDHVPSRPLPVRRARSEHGSPVPVDEFGPQVPPVDIPYPILNHSISSPASMDLLPQSAGSPYVSDIDTLFDSANLTVPPVDSSTFDLYGQDAVSTTAFSHPASLTSYDYSGFSNPGLTRSSSGNVSEVSDISPIAGIPVSDSINTLQKHDLRSVGDLSKTEQYSVSTSSPYFDMSQALLMASPSNIDGTNLDSFLPVADAGVPSSMPTAPDMPMIPQLEQHYPGPEDVVLQPSGQHLTSTQDTTTQTYVVQPPLTTTIADVPEHTWLPVSYPLAASPVAMATHQYSQSYAAQWSQ
ncbi:hypothetical protein VTO42DRAFT_8285 [Malbranchea cinnamomea]